jgi:hypothetical protein
MVFHFTYFPFFLLIKTVVIVPHNTNILAAGQSTAGDEPTTTATYGSGSQSSVGGQPPATSSNIKSRLRSDDGPFTSTSPIVMLSKVSAVLLHEGNTTEPPVGKITLFIYDIFYFLQMIFIINAKPFFCYYTVQHLLMSYLVRTMMVNLVPQLTKGSGGTEQRR